MLKVARKLSKFILVKICIKFEHLSSKIQLYQSQYRLKRGKKILGKVNYMKKDNDI